MSCPEEQDQYLLLAAGQLDPAEAEALRQHLASGCPACAGALAEAQTVFAAVGGALEPAAVPPQVRQKLLQRMAAPERAASPAATSRARALAWPAMLFRLGVAAAVAASIAVVVTHHVVTLQADRRQAALLAQRDARITELLSQLVHVHQQQQTTFALLQGPALQLTPLQGKQQPHATGQFLLNTDTRQWALLTSNLAPLPPDRTYEFWYITPAGQKLRAGTFSTDTAGSGLLEAQVPPEVGSVAMAAVTDEPAGGTNVPTGAIQLVGKIQ